MSDLARVLGADLARAGAVDRLHPHRGPLATLGLGQPAAHVDGIRCARDGAGPGGWLRRAGSGARRSLLFEVVHEGGVRPGLAAAASLIWLAREAETWGKCLARAPLPGPSSM